MMCMENKILLYVTKTAAEKYIKKFGQMRDIQLYKILFLIQQELLKKQIDMHLPYYWYLKGPLLDVSGFHTQTGVSFTLFSPSKWDGSKKLIAVPSLVVEEPQKKEIIDQSIDFIIDSIPNKSTATQYLLDEVYKYAPNPFQRSFLKFNSSIHYEDYEKAKEIFRKMIKEFPRSKFEKMTELFMEWETTIDVAFEIGKLDVIKGITDAFWKAFCLELSVMEHENLTKEQEQRLIERLDKEYPLEEKTVYDLCSQFYLSLDDSDFPEESIHDRNGLNKLAFDEYCAEEYE